MCLSFYYLLLPFFYLVRIIIFHLFCSAVFGSTTKEKATRKKAWSYDISQQAEIGSQRVCFEDLPLPQQKKFFMLCCRIISFFYFIFLTGISDR